MIIKREYSMAGVVTLYLALRDAFWRHPTTSSNNISKVLD